MTDGSPRVRSHCLTCESIRLQSEGSKDQRIVLQEDEINRLVSVNVQQRVRISQLEDALKDAKRDAVRRNQTIAQLNAELRGRKAG